MISVLRLVVFAFLCVSLRTVTAGEFSLDDTVSPAGLSQLRISPDGQHVIGIGYKDQIIAVFALDLETSVLTKIVSGSPQSASWITNDLVAVQYADAVYAFDLRGHRIAELGYYSLGKAIPMDPSSTLINVILNQHVGGLAQVDARTGKATKLRYPSPGDLVDTLFDAKGGLRAVTLTDSQFWDDKTTISNWYRPRDGEWVKLAEFGASDRHWRPVAVLEDDTTLAVMSSIGRDTTALFSYDTATRQIGEMMIGHPTQDISQVSGMSLANPARVITSGMKPEQYWLDPEWQAAQIAVDQALPDHLNSLSGNPKGRVLVFSWSDVDPGGWYVVDMVTSKLTFLVRSMPKIDIGKMRPKEIMSYAARDGLKIPAYLTRPTGRSDNLPLVVLIHGGPWVRDNWDWDLDVQMLAAHGYAVFQPQFRGSGGFGRKFMELGFGQWGLSMQDDITDGVQYLIGNGIADPRRICIYGGSYGGYAALWGMVKTPELYRCGVSFAGVSDIGKFLSGGSDVNSSKISREKNRFAIGDVKLNAEQFDAVSPLKHADRIQAPILLMHGADDERVPTSHGRNMDKALTKFGKPHEWYVFQNEGHGLNYLSNSKLYYERLFAFLDKYIGNAEVQKQ